MTVVRNTFIDISEQQRSRFLHRSPSAHSDRDGLLADRLYHRRDSTTSTTLCFRNVQPSFLKDHALAVREWLPKCSYDLVWIHANHQSPNGTVYVNFKYCSIAQEVIVSAGLPGVTAYWAPCQGLSDCIALFKSLCQKIERVDKTMAPIIYDKKMNPTAVSIAEPKKEPVSRAGPRAFEKIFIGGIQDTITVRELRSHFSRFGTLVDCGIVKDFNGKSRGFGFCKYASLSAAEVCLATRNHTVQGVVLGVRPYVLRNNNNVDAKGETQRK